MEDASTVVSERGEILSPKYAPEMIAPAIRPSLKPSALPMPRSATPMVAMVVQELPSISETAAQMMQAAGRKKDGDSTFTP